MLQQLLVAGATNGFRRLSQFHAGSTDTVDGVECPLYAIHITGTAQCVMSDQV